MNPWDKAGSSRATKKSPIKFDVIPDVIQIDDDDDDDDAGQDEKPKRINNGEREEEGDGNDSMQEKLEHWRNYGARKLSKLGLQHQDEAEFYGFAMALLEKHEESLKEFIDFVEDEKKPESDGDLDLYEDIDTQVVILMDELLRGSKPHLKKLFNGVCIWVNGFVYPVAKTLHDFMSLTGGEFVLTYQPKVTHIISTVISMANKKIDKHQEKTVNAEWILDCLKEEKILELFDYRVLKPKNDIKRMFQKQYKRNRLVAIVPASNGSDAIKDDSDDIDFVGVFPKTPTKAPSSAMKRPANNLPAPGVSSAKISKFVLPPNQPASNHNDDFMPKSMAEIDDDVRNSLPPDILKELENQFAPKPVLSSSSSASSSSTSSKAVKPKLRQQTLTFQAGPKDLKKNSTFQQKPKASTSSATEQPKIDKMIKKQQEFKERSTEQKMIDLYGTKYDRDIGPNLAGRTEFSDVIDLIEEWILNETIGDEDVAYIIRFFYSLLAARRYRHLNEILLNTRAFIDQRVSMGGSLSQQWNDFFYETIKAIMEGEAEYAEQMPDHLFKQ